MRTILTTTATAAGTMALILGLAAPALAQGAGDGSMASPCGMAHGAFADVNGNFGFRGSSARPAPGGGILTS